MGQNIARARTKVFEYAMCNEWDHFITLTLDARKQDREQLKRFHEALGFFIKKENRRRGVKLKYLLVPELHRDRKSWHLHGLIFGLNAHDLTVNANGYMDWTAYHERFGFCSLSPIQSHEAVSKYILKYIGKGFNDRQVGEHLYYCSRGLKTAEHLGTGHLIKEPKWDYENDHVAVAWLKDRVNDYVSLAKEVTSGVFNKS